MPIADHKHVSEDEAFAAHPPQSLSRPSNKWIAALIAGLGTIVVMALTTGAWNTEESIALVGLLVERSTAYLTPNN